MKRLGTVYFVLAVACLLTVAFSSPAQSGAHNVYGVFNPGAIPPGSATDAGNNVNLVGGEGDFGNSTGLGGTDGDNGMGSINLPAPTALASIAGLAAVAVYGFSRIIRIPG